MHDVIVKVHEIKSIGSSPAPNNRNRLKQFTLLHSEAHSITRIRGIIRKDPSYTTSLNGLSKFLPTKLVYKGKKSRGVEDFGEVGWRSN